MAQVIFRSFSERAKAIVGEDQAQLRDDIKWVVNQVHYGKAPELGDITLVPPLLDTSDDDSSADYELEIEEGSDNWPRDDEGDYLKPTNGKEVSLATLNMEYALDLRAERIVALLSATNSLAAKLVFNVFEKNGVATGWYPGNQEDYSSRRRLSRPAAAHYVLSRGFEDDFMDRRVGLSPSVGIK